jgi:hypothetical protein
MLSGYRILVIEWYLLMSSYRMITKLDHFKYKEKISLYIKQSNLAGRISDDRFQ